MYLVTYFVKKIICMHCYLSGSVHGVYVYEYVYCTCFPTCKNMYVVYRRSGLDYVVKQLRMALYKPDCDFNDCELPSGQYIINCIFFFLQFF